MLEALVGASPYLYQVLGRAERIQDVQSDEIEPTRSYKKRYDS